MAHFDNAEDCEMELYSITCTATLGCRLNLRRIAENGYNVVYRHSRITMKLRKPKVTAYIWSSGKMMCFGAACEEEARIGARRVARLIQKAGFQVEVRQLRINLVVACCTLPFGVKLHGFASRYREASYEPELFPGALYRIPSLKASLTVHWTGRILIRAPTVVDVYAAVKLIYPRVEEFRRELTAAEDEQRLQKRLQAQQRRLYQ